MTATTPSLIGARVVALSSAVIGLGLLGDTLIYAVLPLYHAEWGISLFMVGVLLSLNRWIRLLANSLMAAGLIEAETNPDHKRAVLLRATEQGIALKREIDARADAIAAEIGEGVDIEVIRAATAALNTIRKQLEARLRAGEKR